MFYAVFVPPPTRRLLRPALRQGRGGDLFASTAIVNLGCAASRDPRAHVDCPNARPSDHAKAAAERFVYKDLQVRMAEHEDTATPPATPAAVDTAAHDDEPDTPDSSETDAAVLLDARNPLKLQCNYTEITEVKLQRPITCQL